MTATRFREIALKFPGAIESEHMGHPDFRTGGRIFATLGYPDEGWGMVKLTPDQQRSFVETAPDVFRPCKGAWGQRGATNVRLATAKVAMVRAALAAASHNITANSGGVAKR